MNDPSFTAQASTPAWRRALFGALWLLGLCVLGGVIGAHLVNLPRMAPSLRHPGALAGGGLAFILFSVLAWANVLPGARGRGPVRWGTAEALWLFVNFTLMQVPGTLLGGLGMVTIVAIATHSLARGLAVTSNASSAVGMAMCGYLTATWWAVHYVRGAGALRWRDGGATGIGWRPAPRHAYLVAVALALGIVLLVNVIYHILPPDPASLKDAPFAKVFEHPGWAAALIILLAVFVAPFAEELVFRGGMMGGLATRLGPWGAAAVTTVLFVVAHAQEKIHYPPGFIDVGLAATALAWLRLRYGSIKPGILLHLAYNLGVTLASFALP